MTSPDLATIRKNGSIFFEKLLQELERLEVDPTSLSHPDHLCLRVASLAEYESYKLSVSAGGGKLLTETEVNGRPIATYRLPEAFETRQGPVFLLEIPAPKPGSPYPTGFEHAEFVLREGFARFSARHPRLSFSGAEPKILNAELGLITAHGQAKFHSSRLDRVIQIEEARVRDVVFDFDGTIIDARERIYEINASVFSRLLGREVSVEEARANHCADFPGLFDKFGVIDPSTRARGMDVWGEVSSGVSFSLFAGIAELLTELRALGFVLHIWTAREESSTRRILTQQGLEDFFETLSFSNPHVSKPHPDTLNFDWKSCAPNSVIVVGDSWTDMRGAANIGAIAAAALWDTEISADELCEQGAELFLKSPADLLSFLSPRSPKAFRGSSGPEGQKLS